MPERKRQHRNVVQLRTTDITKPNDYLVGGIPDPQPLPGIVGKKERMAERARIRLRNKPKIISGHDDFIS